MKFKKGDKVTINTHRFDESNGYSEFGKKGTISSITKTDIWVKFPVGEFKDGATEGTYNKEDLMLIIPTKLEKLL